MSTDSHPPHHRPATIPLARGLASSDPQLCGVLTVLHRLLAEALAAVDPAAGLAARVERRPETAAERLVRLRAVLVCAVVALCRLERAAVSAHRRRRLPASAGRRHLPALRDRRLPRSLRPAALAWTWTVQAPRVKSCGEVVLVWVVVHCPKAALVRRVVAAWAARSSRAGQSTAGAVVSIVRSLGGSGGSQRPVW